jgi:hypothetical protein
MYIVHEHSGRHHSSCKPYTSANKQKQKITNTAAIFSKQCSRQNSKQTVKTSEVRKKSGAA